MVNRYFICDGHCHHSHVRKFKCHHYTNLSERESRHCTNQKEKTILHRYEGESHHYTGMKEKTTTTQVLSGMPPLHRYVGECHHNTGMKEKPTTTQVWKKIVTLTTRTHMLLPRTHPHRDCHDLAIGSRLCYNIAYTELYQQKARSSLTKTNMK